MKTGSTYTGEINSSNERHGYGVYQGTKSKIVEKVFSRKYQQKKAFFFMNKLVYQLITQLLF